MSEGIEGFLKEYADFLREERDSWVEYAPFTADVQMASGTVMLRDRNGNEACFFVSNFAPDGSEIPYCPSMPVMPHAIGLSKTVCELLNAIAKEE